MEAGRILNPSGAIFGPPRRWNSASTKLARIDIYRWSGLTLIQVSHAEGRVSGDPFQTTDPRIKANEGPDC